MDELTFTVADFGLYKCSKCKGLVYGDDIEEHRVFHAEIAELIDWAQAVSIIFNRKAFSNAQEG